MARKKTVTNMTDALRCARKVAAGQTCTMQELKSSLTLMHTAYKAAQRAKKEATSRISFLERFVQNFRN